MIMKKNKIRICDECKSEFNKDSSEMENLCPECSSILYGYQNCEHNFKGNRCEKCFWNGKSSEYIDKLRNNK
jgi:predicted RNA-binding Zn-ribbon protein involved in translation (DUF1610 family)